MKKPAPIVLITLVEVKASNRLRQKTPPIFSLSLSLYSACLRVSSLSSIASSSAVPFPSTYLTWVFEVSHQGVRACRQAELLHDLRHDALLSSEIKRYDTYLALGCWGSAVGNLIIPMSCFVSLVTSSSALRRGVASFVDVRICVPEAAAAEAAAVAAAASAAAASTQQQPQQSQQNQLPRNQKEEVGFTTTGAHVHTREERTRFSGFLLPHPPLLSAPVLLSQDMRKRNARGACTLAQNETQRDFPGRTNQPPQQNYRQRCFAHRAPTADVIYTPPQNTAPPRRQPTFCATGMLLLKDGADGNVQGG